jgi:hypothetical protein
MYKERFVDGFNDRGMSGRIRLSFFFLEKFHGYISYRTVIITAGHLVPFLTTD